MKTINIAQILSPDLKSRMRAQVPEGQVIGIFDIGI